MHEYSSKHQEFSQSASPNTGCLPFDGYNLVCQALNSLQGQSLQFNGWGRAAALVAPDVSATFRASE